MNEAAIKIEEVITNLIPHAATMLYEGWILKIVSGYMIVYPLYSKSSDNVLERIQRCEQIGKKKGLKCIYRIPQYTNYHLKARLLDHGYIAQHLSTIGSLNLTDSCMRNQIEGGVSRHKVSHEGSELYRVTDSIFISVNKVCGECVSVSDDKQIKRVGVRQENLMYIDSGTKLSQLELNAILSFAQQENISKILVDIPEEDLPDNYGQMGFEKIYTYTCYYKEDI